MNLLRNKKPLTTHHSLLTTQSGQTLIETIVAIFVLTMALTAGLGVAIYAFSTSTTSINEIIASNLAREGVEVVRMMRDSNWLASDVKGSEDSAWALSSCADIGGKLCYPRAYAKVPPYNNYDFIAGNQMIQFDLGGNEWTLDSTGPQNYNLYLQANGSYGQTVNGSSTFARMINISFNSSSPYTNQNSNQEMIVKSVVAWRGKNCAAFSSNQDLTALSTSCKITVEEHLTNWKDYR
jgi:Tfp pilus assembly protein PilV